MAYSTPRTWAAGEKPTAAQFNANIRDDVSFLANPPACRVTHNAAQAVAHNTVTYLAFNTETYDTDTMHDTVTNNGRITFNTAGIYVVTFNFRIAADNDYSIIEGLIRLGGTTILASNGMGTWTNLSDNPPMTVTVTYKFAATNYVEAGVYQTNTSAGSNNVLSQSDSPIFTAVWVGLG